MGARRKQPPGVQGMKRSMKLLIEIVLAIFLHPVAVVFAWINLATRGDMDGAKKILWAIVVVLWGIGPILYILLADGALW